MNETRTESSLFVILGTGDLYRRKLLPALCHLEAEGHLHEQVRVLAVGRSREDEEKFRESSREALAKANLPAGQILACVRRLHYHAIGEGNLEDYRNYKVTCDKARTYLGFLPKYSISDIVKSLYEHIEEYGDFSSDLFYNINTFRKLG